MLAVEDNISFLILMEKHKSSFVYLFHLCARAYHVLSAPKVYHLLFFGLFFILSFYTGYSLLYLNIFSSLKLKKRILPEVLFPPIRNYALYQISWKKKSMSALNHFIIGWIFIPPCGNYLLITDTFHIAKYNRAVFILCLCSAAVTPPVWKS